MKIDFSNMPAGDHKTTFAIKYVSYPDIGRHIYKLINVLLL